MPLDYGDDIDPAIVYRRRKAAKARRRMMVWGGVGVGLFAVAIVMAAVAGGSRVATGGRPSIFGPSPSKEGASWNHSQLLDYIREMGIVPLATAGFSRSSGGQGPVLYISMNEPDLPRFDSESLHFFASRNSPGIAEISKSPTAQEAKDEAGVLGPSGYSWGRFLFRGDPALIARIRKALD